MPQSLPKIVVLNGSCLEVVEQHRVEIESQGVHPIAEERFRRFNSAQTAEVVHDADAVILPAQAGRGIPDAQMMASSPRLVCCAFAASGFDEFPIDVATRNGIVVTYAPTMEAAEGVADLTIGLMLSVARQIPHHHQLIEKGVVHRGWGVALFGSNVGIVGLGNIGSAVARRLSKFGVRILSSTIEPDNAFVKEHGIELVSMEELLRQCDFVTLHVRLDASTRGMIGARELAMMKPSAILINTARRPLIDEAALESAILEGRIGGAGLDDPPSRADSPLTGLPNVVFTPHLGSRVVEGVNAVLQSAIKGSLDVIHGRQPKWVANPEVYRTGPRTSPFVKPIRS